MILLGIASSAEELLFIHLTVNDRYIVDHYEEGFRRQRTLPMDKERLMRTYGYTYDLSGICLDIGMN